MIDFEALKERIQKRTCDHTLLLILSFFNSFFIFNCHKYVLKCAGLEGKENKRERERGATVSRKIFYVNKSGVL